MSGLKVLVVDDSPTFRAILRSVLDRFTEITETREACDGIDALNILEDYSPDLVLLDIEMPRLSGLPTLRIARRRYPSIEVLIVSGATRGSAELTVQALDGGAIDFIIKPRMTNAQAGNDSLHKRLSPFIRYIAVRPERGSSIKKKRHVDWTDSLLDTSPGIPVSHIQNALKDYGAPRDPEKVKVESSQIAANNVPQTKPDLLPVKSEKVKTPTATEQLARKSRTPAPHTNMRLVVIGASTGSPGALASMIPLLPANFPAPIILIVHLPDTFSASFAKHLAKKSQIRVTLANEDEMLLPSTVYLARADKHLIVKFDSSFGPGILPYRLSYLDTPPVDGICPSINLMFESLAEASATGCLGVIMTGMGKDGTKGLRMLKEIPGNYCIAQSPESCVVGSMPLSVINDNIADEVVDLEDLASAIIDVVKNV